LAVVIQHGIDLISPAIDRVTESPLEAKLFANRDL
jgi:hypothetical protein